MVEQRDVIDDWYKIYNSKITRFLKTELCELISIKNTDSAIYKKIISPLVLDGVITFGAVRGNRVLIIVNRDKLETFIKSKDKYKRVETFQILANPFAYI